MSQIKLVIPCQEREKGKVKKSAPSPQLSCLVGRSLFSFSAVKIQSYIHALPFRLIRLCFRPFLSCQGPISHRDMGEDRDLQYLLRSIDDRQYPAYRDIGKPCLPGFVPFGMSITPNSCVLVLSE